MNPELSLAALKQARREKLGALLQQWGTSELSRRTGINPNYLFQMGRATGSSARPVSDKIVERVEAALSMPGYFSDSGTLSASSLPPRPASPKLSSSPAAPLYALSPDEAELLAHYRQSHPVVRGSIKAALREAAIPSHHQVNHMRRIA